MTACNSVLRVRRRARGKRAPLSGARVLVGETDSECLAALFPFWLAAWGGGALQRGGRSWVNAVLRLSVASGEQLLRRHAADCAHSVVISVRGDV